MAKILYGAPVREKIKEELIKKVKKLENKSCLVIVQVGDREDSNIYIKQKQKFGEEIGVKVILKKFDNDIKEKRLIFEIEKLNKDNEVNGIIVQLPLPNNLDSKKLIESIEKQKDADGLREIKDEEEVLVTPATAKAVMTLLDFYNIEVKDKKIAVIGRSRLAGGPIAEVLKERGVAVKVCYKEMDVEEIKNICRESDILISAAGQARLVTKEFVNKDQVVIDVGINRPHPSLRVDPLLVKEREGQTKPSLPKLVGDVNFNEVEPIVSAITPVPGGIGPLTVGCLFENLLDLCYTNHIT